jgi:hypothetical protein
MSSEQFVGPLQTVKSRKGHGRRAANYGAKPKAGKPSKAEMYDRSVAMHMRANLGDQHMTVASLMTNNDRLFTKLQLAEVVRAEKTACQKARRKQLKAEKKARALLDAQKSA